MHLFDGFPSHYSDDQKGVVLAYVSALIFLNIVANPIIYAFKIRRAKRRIRCVVNNISSEARMHRWRGQVELSHEKISLNQTTNAK